MYLLPGNPFSHAVEAYRDSGDALCSKRLHHLPTPLGCCMQAQLMLSEAVGWAKCWHLQTLHLLPCRASGGAVTTFGYGFTDLRIYPPPSPSSPAPRGRASKNQVTAGLVLRK